MHIRRSVAALVFAITAGTVAGISPASADTRVGYGFTLYGGHTINSARTHLTMQADGNLVLYCNSPSTKAIWATGTYSSGNYIVFQADGNLVMYDLWHVAQWSTGTWGKGADTFAVQDDGNLVMYGGGYVFWSSGTNGRC